MRHIKIINLALILNAIVLYSSIASSSTHKDINFSSEKFSEAIERASSEGKLVFLDFYASWCTPCKWMDKTTFNDEKIVETLNKDFIAMKVDIDKMQGFELKNKYDIKYLPTLIILNSKGQLIERIEETLSANKLLTVLNLHNNSENKIVYKHNFNTSPMDLMPSNGTTINPWKISKEDYYRYIEMNENRSYKIQVGLFDNFEEARFSVSELRETFYEPIVVLNDYKDGKVYFRVMLGQFATIAEAENFRKILDSEFDISGIVF